MTYSLKFLPEIEEDIISGHTWYTSKAPGLGDDFVRMFFAATSDISRNPLSHQKVYRNFHRRLIRRFPYAIYYEVSRDEVIVFGLFHCARNPKAIKRGLEERRSEGKA